MSFGGLARQFAQNVLNRLAGRPTLRDADCFPPMNGGLIDIEAQPKSGLAFTKTKTGFFDLFFRDHGASNAYRIVFVNA